MITKVLLLLLAAGAVASAQAPAAMFRGDASHSGHYAGGGERIVGLQWRVPTDGDVVATPVASAGVVYVGSGSGVMYALDERTGSSRWTVDLASPIAIDAATGALRWRADHHVSWVNSSPAVAEGVVFAGSSDAHFLQAVDAASGKELWKAPSNGIVWSSPAVAGRFVYWGDGPGRIHVTDRASGAELSAFRTGSQVFSSPVVDGDLLFVGSGDGGIYALRLGAASDAPKRAVFFDSTYLRASQINNSSDVAGYLAHGGYETVDAKSVVKFLQDHVADRAPSVVVFSIDLPPAEIVKPPLATSLLRRYLDAGGKIVWLGLPPSIWPVEPLEGQRKSLNEVVWTAPEELLGVPHGEALFDQRGARATSVGQHWGLTSRFRATWSVAPAGVTNVLALDDWGLAAAWSKEYGGARGTGFVRVPAENVLSVHLAAEYRPR